jgi:hypothetical protein
MHLLGTTDENSDIGAIFAAARTVLAEIMMLDKKHDCSIKLLMTIYNTQEISWISLCENLCDD